MPGTALRSIIGVGIMLLMSGCKTPAPNDGVASPADLAGVWHGEAVDSPGRTRRACNVRMPIAFIVMDGRAISLSENPKLQFDVDVEPNGGLSFTYKQVVKHTSQRGGRFPDTRLLDVHFDGRLSPEQGEGRFSVANCSGKWKVQKVSRSLAFDVSPKRDQREPLPKSVTIFETLVVYEFGKPKFTVHDGDILDVVSRKVCRSGSGECWKVRNRDTGEIGYVTAAEMRRNHGLTY